MELKKISLILVLAVVAMVVMPTASAMYCDDVVDPSVNNCELADCDGEYYCALSWSQETGYDCTCRGNEGTCNDFWLWPNCDDGGCPWREKCEFLPGNNCGCLACVNQPEFISCIDHDGGLDEYTSSYVTAERMDCDGKIKEGVNSDNCQNETLLYEMLCTNGQPDPNTAVTCVAGCVNGACNWPYCWDGTFMDDCSEVNVGKYCTESRDLIDLCSICPCGLHQTCSSVDEICYDDCNKGGGVWINHTTCDSSDKPKFCSDGTLHDVCSVCECPTSTPVCEGSGSCRDYYGCTGGFDHGECDYGSKPERCNDGTMEDDCNYCNCPPSTPKCNQDGSCTVYASCGSTPHGQCVIGNKPKKCVDGTLIDDCQTCDCSPPYNYCNSQNGQCYV